MKSFYICLMLLTIILLMSGCTTVGRSHIDTPKYYPEQTREQKQPEVRPETTRILPLPSRHSDPLTRVAASVVFIQAIIPTDTLIENENVSSGILLPGGWVITTGHGLEKAHQIKVTLAGNVYSGNLKALDSENDMALIGLEHDPAITGMIPRVRFNYRPILGMNIYCIGFPVLAGVEDSQPTITGGIVSALDRSLRRSNGQLRTGLIQIDAVATDGNSGGPVFDQEGRVLGLTGYTLATRTIWSGATFVIPACEVKAFLKQHGFEVK